MSAPFILASASPRRRELMRLLDVEFTAHASGIDETQLSGEPADVYVARLAREKAEDVARLFPGKKVLGCDTIVVVDGVALGKPIDDADAARMLRLLAGRAHDVLTAIHLIPGGGEVVRTRVYFTAMSEREIADYVATGEARDKAGAYGIQGYAARFVERIEGCYYNVMGLPVAALYQKLRDYA